MSVMEINPLVVNPSRRRLVFALPSLWVLAVDEPTLPSLRSDSKEIRCGCVAEGREAAAAAARPVDRRSAGTKETLGNNIGEDLKL